MENKYIAIAKYIPYSPYKLRPLADIIRSKNVDYALNWLHVYRNKRTVPLVKVIESALANARNLKCNNKSKDLYIEEIKVDQGPIRKYFKPGAQGRSTILRRRFSHISVIIGSKKQISEGVNSGTEG